VNGEGAPGPTAVSDGARGTGSPPTAGGHARGWAIAGAVAAAGLVALLIANPPDVEGEAPVRTATGDGVKVDLPEGWRASTDPLDLVPPIGISGADAQVVEDYLRALATDRRLAIVAYGGIRTLLVDAVRLDAPDPPIERVVTTYLRGAEDAGYALVERGRATVDEERAERMVFRNAETGEQTLDLVWVDGRTVYIATFSTSRSDFVGAEATFDRIAETMRSDPSGG
jgi:hypothetical protein